MCKLLGFALGAVIFAVTLAGILWLLWWMIVVAAAVAVVALVWRAIIRC